MVQMMSNMLVLTAAAATSLLLLASGASAAPYPFGVDFSGEGTYYGDVSPGDGNCAIEDPIPSMYSGMIPMAVSLYDMYENSAVCGACVEGYGTGGGSGADPIKGPFKGFISDSCGGCAKGDLDFAMVGDGRWDIEWKFVECPSGGNPSFIFEGSNDWYWKIQPRETKSPVIKLTVNGEEATMTQDNFFTATAGPFYGQQTVTTTTLFGETKTSMVSL